MKTDAEFAAWLASSGAQRVMLFEVGVITGGVATTRYLSNKLYNPSATTPHQAVVVGGLKVTESISMMDKSSLSAGDIEINNAGGARDAWLDDVWTNQPIAAYLGDVQWDRTDFRQVFAGTLTGIACKSRDRLALQLVNKLERLNTPVTDATIGGNAVNPGALVPVLLGECHNISPPQTNQGTATAPVEYGFGDGANESVFEVRTEAKPRSEIASTPATGRFTFTAAVGPGQVTCSAQGTKFNGVYVNTIGMLVQYLVTQRGKASTRFTTDDLDVAQLATFEQNHPQPVGLYLVERTNVLDACDQLANSVGAQLVMSMTGKLRLIQFAIPTAATVEIPRSRQLDNSITITNRTEVAAGATIGYCKNWTVQANLATTIPDAHKALYAQEWLSVTSVDAAVQALYKLDAAPDQIDTYLLRLVDAQAEADRRRDIVKVQRTTYSFEAPASLLLLELGQAVKLYSDRFGLAAGKVGLLTSRTVDWSNLHSTLEVTV